MNIPQVLADSLEVLKRVGLMTVTELEVPEEIEIFEGLKGYRRYLLEVDREWSGSYFGEYGISAAVALTVSFYAQIDANDDSQADVFVLCEDVFAHLEQVVFADLTGTYPLKYVADIGRQAHVTERNRARTLKYLSSYDGSKRQLWNVGLNLVAIFAGLSVIFIPGTFSSEQTPTDSSQGFSTEVIPQSLTELGGAFDV